MSDAKKRYLIVPDEAWTNAELVSATSQAGLTVKQPDPTSVDGDIRVVVSGEPTEEFETDLVVDRYGLDGDTRYYFDYGLSSDQIWGRAPFGLVQGRPDVLEVQDSTESAHEYFEPIGWYHHPDEAKVSLLVHKRPQRPNIAPATPIATIGFGTGSGIFRYVFDRQTRAWSTPTTLFSTVDTALAWAVVALQDGTGLLFGVGVGHVETWVTEDNFASIRKRSTVRVTFPGAEGQITSASAVVLPSGRIVLCVARTHMADSYLSDDNGLSWQTNQVLSWEYNSAVVNVAVAVSPQGIVFLSLSYVDDNVGATMGPADAKATKAGDPNMVTALYLSTSGETWAGGAITRQSFLSATPCFDAEGRLFLLGVPFVPTCSAGGSDADIPNAYAFAFANKQIAMGDDPTLAFSAYPNQTEPLVLLSHNVPRVTGAAYENIVDCLAPRQGMFGTVAVAEIDGTLYAASGTVFETAEIDVGEDIAEYVFVSSALRVHPISSRSNVLEAPRAVMDDLVRNAGNGFYGRQYLSAWDGTEYPDDLGWTKAGAGSASFAAFNANGRYLRTSVAPTQALNWTSPIPFFPTAAAFQNGLSFLSRVVVRGDSGGSSLRDEAAVRYRGVSNSSRADETIDVSLRFIVSGTGIGIFVYDNHAATTRASVTVANAAGKWVEVLWGSTAEKADEYDPGTFTGFLFYRIVHSESAGEVDRNLIPYQGGLSFSLNTAGPALAAVSSVQFGHMVNLNTTVFGWKSVQFNLGNVASEQNRVPAQFLTALRLVAENVGRVSNFYPNPVYDQEPWSGQPTGTRAHILSNQPSYLLRGTFVSGQGRSLLRGSSLPINTAHVHSAENLLPSLPVFQAYKSGLSEPSQSGADEMYLTFQLDGGLVGTALALFGRNTPSIRIQMNQSNVWTSPAVDVQICTPYDNEVSARIEYGHVFAADTSQLGYSTHDNTLKFSSATPWRRHQFRSQETGQTFYAVLYAGFSQSHVYRIKDNTENTLVLDAPSGLYASSTTMAIFSDRVAFDLGSVITNQSSPLTWVRVVFQGCRWSTADEQHHRLGALWLGHMHDLSEPDFQWQWQRSTESGTTLVNTPAGPTYSKRNAQFRRTFVASKPIMKSAQVATSVTTSSTLNQIRGSWEETINLLERLEVDGTRCALVWQGERATAGNDETQRTTDPLELIACRVQSAGTLQNDAYSCQTMNLASGSGTAVPRPRASIAQIAFREEF
jgi:hypothetical protein